MKSELNDVNEHRINLASLVLKVLMNWKIILLGACIFAVLGYGYAKYAQMKASNFEMADISNETEEALLDYDTAEENVYEAQMRYENALVNESNYADNSFLMKLDPYHVVATVQEFEISTDKDRDLNELIVSAKWFCSCALDQDIMTRIAKKYNTDPQFIREVVGANLRDSQNIANSVQINTELTTDKGKKSVGFYIIAKGLDAEFSKTVVQQISDYILEKSTQIQHRDFSLEVLPAITNESIDFSVISSQNESRYRMYDYSDKIVKIDTTIENLKKAKASDEAVIQKNYSGKKYAAAGFVGGMILFVVLLLLRYVLATTIQTAEDFRSCFLLSNLGVAPLKDSSRRGIKKKITNRLQGRYADFSQELFCEMTSTNISNAANGKQKVLVTGSIDQDDMQSLSNQLMPSLKEKSSEVEFIFAGDFPCNPETRALLKHSDGVILVEKRNFSSIEIVSEEIDIIEVLGKEILGSILL